MSQRRRIEGDDADYVFFSGRVHTVDADDRIAKAVAVNGDRIVVVGSSATVRPLAKRGSAIDLRGRSLVPGLIDAHAHAGLFGARKLGIDCKAADLVVLGADLTRVPAGEVGGSSPALSGTLSMRKHGEGYCRKCAPLAVEGAWHHACSSPLHAGRGEGPRSGGEVPC